MTSPVKTSIRLQTAPAAALQETLAQHPGTLFAVVDTCDDAPALAKVQELGDQAVSLYRGRAEEQYWAIAPYLVQIDPPLLEWLLATLGATPWGFLVSARSDMASLRKHFRRWLMVQLPAGKPAYFRFYDPRVLLAYLPTCSHGEVEDFLGPISTIWLVDEANQLTTVRRAAAMFQVSSGDDAASAAGAPARGKLIQIRRAQFEALAQNQWGRFIQRMVERAQSLYAPQLAAQKISPGALETMLRRGLAQAEQYGIEGEADLEVYCDCLFQLGPNFDRDERNPPAAILRETALNGTEKMDRIASHLLWATAK